MLTLLTPGFLPLLRLPSRDPHAAVVTGDITGRGFTPAANGTQASLSGVLALFGLPFGRSHSHFPATVRWRTQNIRRDILHCDIKSSKIMSRTQVRWNAKSSEVALMRDQDENEAAYAEKLDPPCKHELKPGLFCNQPRNHPWHDLSKGEIHGRHAYEGERAK